MFGQPGVNCFQISFRAFGQFDLELLIRRQRATAFDRSSSTIARAGLLLPASMS